jgi:hypothetical protein
MPRNYSVKQTIEMLKNGEAIIIGSNKNQSIFYPGKTSDIGSRDEIIKFNPPKGKEDHKKWYQFWK